MDIGLIDVDGHNFPNLALMKLSAWHKTQGDRVELVTDPIVHYDRAYMSKVFSFSNEPYFCVNADETMRGGTGYCISTIKGKECFDESQNNALPPEIEHTYPDYELYGITDTAYGFMTRGCPKASIHGYCHVGAKEGSCSVKVADLSEFWRGQSYIQLMDPNTLACKESPDLLRQLADSGASVDFNQGLDIQLMTETSSELLSRIQIQHVHFAWDNYDDKAVIVPKFERLKERTGWNRDKVSVYVLVNYDTTTEQDLERIEFLRSMNFQPYPMIYSKGEFFNKNGKLKSMKSLLKKYTKEQIDHAITCRHIQRWCNPFIFWTCERFKDYQQHV